MMTGERFLRFRCTGCGNCCREPLLPLTDADLSRIVRRTGERARDIVRWVDRDGIEMDDEPEGFVMLRQGKRVMVLRHEHGRCRYLGADDRCTIYSARPLGCRVFPLNPTFNSRGKLRRLEVVQATEECPYELDGRQDPKRLGKLHERYETARERFHDRIREWNRTQRARRRAGKAVQTARQFLQFIGFEA